MPDFVGKARPPELKTPLLVNPHKGCATFQRFNGDPLNEGERWSEEGPLEFPPARTDVTDGYLPSTVAYCRWFWDVLEPEEGRYDFSMVEKALDTARERGQTLQVRLMPHGSRNQPQLPRWYREKYPTSTGKKKPGSDYVEPDYDGDEYFEKWGGVIRAFGERFDGHPDLEAVDIAFIGPCGEGAGDCSEEAVERFIDLYFDVHRKTPLLANTDGYQFPYGVKKGAGWRCDCFGDLRADGKGVVPDHLAWNHMYDFYPMAVCRAGAQEVWRSRPVVFETCSVPLTWFRRGYDLDFIIRQGYKYHCSVFMPKSNPIPDEYMKPLAEFCDRIGYRFVLRQARWEPVCVPGESFLFSAWVENTGVAPVYRRYSFVLRIVRDRGEHIVVLEDDVRKWLPGDAWIEKKIPLPAGFGKGPAMLYAGIVRPETLRPGILFANEGVEDGWLPLERIEVK